MSAEPGSPIRVAFCITELDPGGAERCLVELVERIDRRQFAPVVYCLGPRPEGNRPSLADRLESAGVGLHTFGARRLVQLPWIIRAVGRQMKADRPQIVQSFLFHANMVAPLAARRAGVPHAVTGIRVAERQSGWHLRAARWADRWVTRHVCVSQGVQEFSAGRGGLPGEKLVVIANGVDLTRFGGPVAGASAGTGAGHAAEAAAGIDLKAGLGLAAERRLITFVGRLDAQKGLAWLLELMPHVMADLTEHDLLLVGSGPERTALERQAVRLGIAGRVRFAGYRADVPEVLAASDLLVLPSRWEGMPNVVLEAMAAGKPVVATDVEGVTEALGPAAAQQVVRPDHGEAFAAKMRAILNSPALAAELGRVNRQRVEQFFRVETMVAAYEQLYRSLAAGEIRG